MVFFLSSWGTNGLEGALPVVGQDLLADRWISETSQARTLRRICLVSDSGTAGDVVVEVYANQLKLGEWRSTCAATNISYANGGILDSIDWVDVSGCETIPAGAELHIIVKAIGAGAWIAFGCDLSSGPKRF